jgi:hypothetical protein
MYTRVHAQKKHILCGQVDERETHLKKKTSHGNTHGQKIRKRLKCVHAYMYTRSKKSQPKAVISLENYRYADMSHTFYIILDYA